MVKGNFEVVVPISGGVTARDVEGLAVHIGVSVGVGFRLNLGVGYGFKGFRLEGIEHGFRHMNTLHVDGFAARITFRSSFDKHDI